MALPTRLMLATGLCLLVHGCTTASSGAVELSWKLRPEPGVGVTTPFVSCDESDPSRVPVAQIRLSWDVGGATGDASWPCGDNRGATNFELPTGPALLTISPICASGEAATGTYIAPAPIERNVTAGDTVTLGAVVLVLRTASCSAAQPCICQ